MGAGCRVCVCACVPLCMCSELLIQKRELKISVIAPETPVPTALWCFLLPDPWKTSMTWVFYTFPNKETEAQGVKGPALSAESFPLH